MFPMSRASLEKDPADVAAMFDRTAERYDLLNGVLSGGQDRLWRRAVARAVAARAGQIILDLGAGTGASAVPLARAGARCVACDFSLGMLRVGVRRRAEGSLGRRARGHGGKVSFVAGDALRLPFADAAFDAVTISFGLRNVADVGVALREMRRVARPGGRLVICEFSRPPNPVFGALYNQYLMKLLPRLARIGSNPEAYGYLSESISAWPDQEELAGQLHEAGWEAVTWRNLSLGAVAVHRARRPADSTAPRPGSARGPV
jgi:demethylmenaquinone methyltransferase/2-methoxy-6-polyprenyl-1,4-benzoquinol methylase